MAHVRVDRVPAAFFLDDSPGAPREAVLGIRSRVFDGRQLWHEPVLGTDTDVDLGRGGSKTRPRPSIDDLVERVLDDPTCPGRL